jgi:hypothetical protein
MPAPATTPVEGANQPAESALANSLPAVNAPPPPRPTVTLPRLGEVAATPERKAGPATTPAPVITARLEAAPSPLILQIEAAIAAKNLLEPKNASAWELYQKLAADPAAASEAARLRPALADALMNAGRAIVAGDVCSDSVADRVDDFRRAGQMLARARSLRPEHTEISALEKLSAAQALIALQFYDEAERALAPLQAAKLAAVENARGLVHQGKLDNFRAERAFKRAAELDQNWAAPHFNLALLYRSQQNESALAELEQAASLDGKNLQVADDDGLHTKLGHALYSQGLAAEANREYQKARELRSRQQ